jgi:hypothetical protein
MEAINASSDGDTVLVYPGTYFENVNFNGKNITLASLNLITGDPGYIVSTIIDGNQSGSCIRVISGENGNVIQGFTLQGGGGYIHGGGINIKDGINIHVINCIIKDNKVDGAGGGIRYSNSSVYLSGVTIKNNHAYGPGGGISLVTYSTIEFDSVNRCNIYLNYASLGCDIHKSNKVGPIHVIVDTFTVLNPDSYFLSSIDSHGFQVGDITWDIQNSKVSQINNDLYVNPLGSDTNSGLTTDEPLRSISFALSKIISDSTHPNTIHIANGVYALSTTNEKYTLNLRSYISFEGEDQDSTILDGDSLIYLIKGNNEIRHFNFKNLTIRNGNGITSTWDGVGLVRLYVVDNATFENVSFTKGVGDFRSTFSVKGHRCKFINCKMFNNYGGKPHSSIGNRWTPVVPDHKDTVELINCRYYDNKPGMHPDYGSGDGIMIDGVLTYPNSMTVNIIGCEFVENKENYTGTYAVNSIALIERSKVNLVNSTIGNNVCMNNAAGYAIGVFSMGHLDIYNSILYGNIHKQICVAANSSEPCTLNIYNSLVQGGLDEIFINDPIHSVYYDPSNIDLDPMWDTTNYYPYGLLPGSPCIDAGTLDLPEGIELPETDLAGNPRVYGNTVDMGAYEYGPWVGISEQNGKRQTANENLLKVSPNPFYYATYITYKVPESGHVVIQVYDMQGRIQTTLMDTRQLPGSGKFYWNGTSDNGMELPRGTYIINITINNREKDAVKVVKH